MIRSIIQIGNPLLEKESQQVSFPLDMKMKAIVEDLKDTLKSTGDLGVGISAVQIAEPYKISIAKDFDLSKKLKKIKSLQKLFSTDVYGKTFEKLLEEKDIELYKMLKNSSTDEAPQDLLYNFINEITDFIIVNPEVIRENDYDTYFYEGCLSVGVGDDALYAPVGRAEELEFKYYDLDGIAHTKIVKNYFAHVVLHEIDHMNGILFLSRVADPSKIWKSKDLDKYYEKHGKYPPMF